MMIESNPLLEKKDDGIRSKLKQQPRIEDY